MSERRFFLRVRQHVAERLWRGAEHYNQVGEAHLWVGACKVFDLLQHRQQARLLWYAKRASREQVNAGRPPSLDPCSQARTVIAGTGFLMARRRAGISAWERLLSGHTVQPHAQSPGHRQRKR